MVCLPSGGERVDYVAETGERSIDLLRLLKRLSLRARLAHFLAPCQVDEAELGRILVELEVDVEEGMASRTLLVHLGGCHLPPLRCVSHQAHHLHLIFNQYLFEPLDVDLSALVFLEFQVDPNTEHIDQLLLVQFHHGAFDLHLA